MVVKYISPLCTYNLLILTDLSQTRKSTRRVVVRTQKLRPLLLSTHSLLVIVMLDVHKSYIQRIRGRQQVGVGGVLGGYSGQRTGAGMGGY